VTLPFLRHEYQRGWWEHRGGGEWQNAQLVLVSAREDGRLIGVAPLFIAEYEGKPALLLIGSIEISDYLDLIVRMDDHSRFITGLLDFLASSLPFDTAQGDPITGQPSIGITSPIHLPPSPPSKRNLDPVAGSSGRDVSPHSAHCPEW
jgi:hypothetical protein